MIVDPRGRHEKALRNRFRAQWEALNDADRAYWIGRAANDCGRTLSDNLPDTVIRLLEQYAWTMFAESMDPNESQRIALLFEETAGVE